jgi:hypothetical protein
MGSNSQRVAASSQKSGWIIKFHLYVDEEDIFLINARRTATVFLIIWSGLLAGCSERNSPEEINIPDFSDEADSPPADFSGESGGAFFGYGDEWPDYIPAEIPELEGEISLVMESAESHIRIFYDNISENQIEDYLAELQDAGFHLEFLVYVTEGFPDNSEEKIKKGEYDAVDITKGEYHMRLEFGGSEATYDIYTSGFEEEAIAATTPQWPVELQNLIPPPERCELTSVDQAGGFNVGYLIRCKPEDDEVFPDYANALYTLGYYKEPNIVSVDESSNLWLTDGNIKVRIQYSLMSELMLQIEKQQSDAAPALEWPQELEGQIPPPERCEIMSVLPSAEIMISCKPEDTDVLQDYLSELRDLGFEEDNVFEGVDGVILSVTMVRMETFVQIMISTDSIMIQIK